MIVSTLSTESTTSEAAPLFKAELTEVLNGIHQLELVTVADSELTAEIKEDYTIIFKDEQGFKEFCIDEVVDSESSYISEKTVTATFSPIELKDELLLNNYTYDNASLLLNYMLKGTRWQLGTVDSAIFNRNFNEETENESVWTGINAVAKVFEADLYFHVSVSEKKVVQRYVSLYKQLGSNSGKRFEIDKDITEIKRTVDTTDIKTAIYPLGKETEDENGNKRRIDISSVSWSVSKGDPVDKPAGQMFISDNEAKLQWGRRNSDGTIRDRFIFMEMDFDSPESLASMAWVQLGRYRKPKVTYEAKVIDLYRLTQDEELKHEKVFLGDTVSVIDRNFSNPIEITEKVVQLKTDLLMPENTSVVIGNSKSSYSSDINRVDDIAKQVSSVESSVNSVITSANGKNKTYYGTVEPVHSELAIGDSWVRPHPENPTEKQWLTWNGTNWDTVLDTSETSQIKSDIEELDQISKEIQEKADQAIEDAGFSKIEIGKINKELIEITADTDVALDEARQAKQEAFNSEQLANSAKQDAILAIQKGDQNSTQITTLEGQQKLTNTKVEGNTANILSLQTDSEKLSLSIGKVEADLGKVSSGTTNLLKNPIYNMYNRLNFVLATGTKKIIDYNCPESKAMEVMVTSKTGEYLWYYSGFKGSPVKKLLKGQQYTISFIISSEREGIISRATLNQAVTDKFILGQTTNEPRMMSVTFTPLVDSDKTDNMNLHFFSNAEYNNLNVNNLFTIHSFMLSEGSIPNGFNFAIEDMTTKSEFSTFEQTSKGFQQTAESDITNLKSEQTQMAGQITNVVRTQQDVDSEEKVLNSNFENDEINKPPLFWATNDGQRALVVQNPDTVAGDNKSNKVLRIIGNKDTHVNVVSDEIKVTPNATYKTGMRVRWGGPGNAGGTIHYTLQFLDINKNVLNTLNLISDTSITAWRYVKGANAKAPSNAYYAKVWINNKFNPQPVWVDDISLQKIITSEDIDGTIASKSEVIQLSDQITQTVNKVETVDGKVTQQQSQITQLDNRITTIAKETTELGTKVTSIEQTTKGIQSSVVEIENKQIKQQSQITQLSNNINLKVDKDNSIAQINLSPETIRLDAKFIHLSGTSKIDNAVIKNAMIDTMTASKLTAGTINASEINVINLNAANLSTGYINADRIKSNSITADKVHIEELSALSSNLGEVYAGKLYSPDIQGASILSSVFKVPNMESIVETEYDKDIHVTQMKFTRRGLFLLTYVYEKKIIGAGYHIFKVELTVIRSQESYKDVWIGQQEVPTLNSSIYTGKTTRYPFNGAQYYTYTGGPKEWLYAQDINRN